MKPSSMKRTNPYQNFLLALSACILMLASNAVVAAAGKVVFATGDVQVERAGKLLPVAKDTVIEAGDTVITGASGRAQLLMADGDRMALRTNTRLRVDEFKAPTSSQKPETGRSFYSLVKGGFRAVTRSLDRRGLDSYRVKTPVATLGIRGTTYWIIQWPGDAQYPAGFYFGVSEGGINVGNTGGQMSFGSGQYGYVKDANSPPQRLPGPPSFFKGNGNGGNGNQDSNDTSGGYSGGSPPHGCTGRSSGDVNCPPIQPIQGDDFDFTPGQSPNPHQPTGPIIIEGPTDGPCSDCIR
jgi:hypothetical protein